MLIGVIGPSVTIKDIKEIAKKHELYAEIKFFPYENYTEALELVKQHEEDVDALLFTGQTPFRYVSDFLTPKVPWEYIPRNTVSTLCALIKANFVYHYESTHISMDGFDTSTVQKIQDELDTAKSKFVFHNSTFDLLSPDYIEQSVSYHLDNFRSGRATLCLTGLQRIYEILKEQNVPVVKVAPATEIFLQRLELLRLRHKILEKENSQIAVIIVQADFFQEYSVYNKSEIHSIRMESKVAEAVYFYAQRLGAAVLRDKYNRFYLFSTGEIIASETENFSRINLLRSVLGNEHLSALSIGIGIAKTSQEAKVNAEKAEQRASQKQPFCCYVINESGEIFGPLSLENQQKEQSIDKNLSAISYKTGIGIMTLHRLEQTLEQYNIKMTTPAELAHYCKMSLRSMNRLLVKLEENGYVQVVGKQPSSGSGRPSRIIKINFDL